MGALRNPEISLPLIDEIERLHRARFSLLPLGREGGKAPLCKYQPDEWLSLGRILAPKPVEFYEIIEAAHGPRIRLLRPTEQPHSDNSALRASDCPEDATPVSGPSVGEG